MEDKPPNAEMARMLEIAPLRLLIESVTVHPQPNLAGGVLCTPAIGDAKNDSEKLTTVAGVRYGVMDDKRRERNVRIIIWWLSVVVCVRKCAIAACLLLLRQRRRIDRSGESVSRTFNRVLSCMMRLGRVLLKTPEPIPQDSTDGRWKWFKEGSAADGRVLYDAITRPNGLKVPHDCYYLVDAGYTNGEGFLAPYKGQRYHLNEWRDGRRPVTPQEYFNMRHSSARNVIERCFGMLRMRWAILRSPSFYPVRKHNRIVTACCLLHNLIRRYSASDPMEDAVIEGDGEGDYAVNSTPMETHTISSIETSSAWSNWRDSLASMSQEQQGRDSQEQGGGSSKRPLRLCFMALIPQSHKRSAPFRTKPFPLFDQLTELFGKDRANGKEAESAADFFEQLSKERDVEVLCNEGDYIPQPLESEMDMRCIEKPTQTTESSSSMKKRKKVKDTEDDVLNKAVDKICASMDQGLERATKELCFHMMSESEVAHKVDQLYNDLLLINGITSDEVYSAHVQLSTNPCQLLSYSHLPDHAKLRWIQSLLRKN
ncbi:protein ALP1-like [Senna tora]|uniref:Protein ALP1-like n=1 Tax=Senna tora TaxID=362788 RepID=A0A834W719_9FABA|nr:protein ALP1-like [Senna tora]